MDLRHLRYFVAMAEAGSMTKASERLRVAQPALSVHLANLEVELGTKLVIRSNRGIELTEDGTLLYERAIIILRYHQEALDALSARKQSPKGIVTLGLPSTVPALITPLLYQTMREELPDVSLYVADTSTAVLYEWLLDGKIDLALLFSLPEDGALELRPLYAEDFCLVGAPVPDGETGPIEFDEIFDVPLVVPHRSTAWRKILDDAAASRGRRIDAPMETESYSALRAVARSGEAQTILPLSSVLEDVQEGRLVARKIVNPDLSGMMSLAHLKNAELSRAVQEVRDLVVRVVRLVSEQMKLEARVPSAAHILKVTPSTLFPMRAASVPERNKKHLN